MDGPRRAMCGREVLCRSRYTLFGLWVEVRRLDFYGATPYFGTFRGRSPSLITQVLLRDMVVVPINIVGLYGGSSFRDSFDDRPIVFRCSSPF